MDTILNYHNIVTTGYNVRDVCSDEPTYVYTGWPSTTESSINSINLY